MLNAHYDVLIVGAGIAGTALAQALSTITSPALERKTPLRIALLERSLAEPDRIVGELLQPGGVRALTQLGMRDCLDGIDAVPVHGYCVVEDGKTVQIPYPTGFEGRSFHHGRFIQRLREAAGKARGVDMIEATVTELVECRHTSRVIGVRANVKGGADVDEHEKQEQRTLFADLIVIADGCFSNFRNAVVAQPSTPSLEGKVTSTSSRASTKSHFIGAILDDAQLPIKQHGTVALIKGSGPVLLYQISEHDTRMLVDIKAPLPIDLKRHITTNILPQLPLALHGPITTSLSAHRLRRMPNSFLPSHQQGTTKQKEGVLLLGDAYNMRHPLTGGGMTVAFCDVVLLGEMLGELGSMGLGDWDSVREVLKAWHWRRKPLASTINILSVALYDLFGADGEELEVLRVGCFKYFERGGECVNGPVSLLSGIAPSPVLLASHFFAVAFYAIWVMFTHPHELRSGSPSNAITDPSPETPSNLSSRSSSPTLVGTDDADPFSEEEKHGKNSMSVGTVVYVTPRVAEYPALVMKSFRVFWTACVVFGPLLWTEIRWW